MTSIRIYIISSTDFSKSEYRAKCTQITDDDKLKKWLERIYDNVTIHHTTQQISITQKTTADEMLKTSFGIRNRQPYTGRWFVILEDLIEIVDDIAQTCIRLEKEKIQREKDEMTLFEQCKKKIKYSSYFDVVSSEDEEPDSDDRDFVVDEEESADDPTSESYGSSDNEEESDDDPISESYGSSDNEEESDDDQISESYGSSDNEEESDDLTDSNYDQFNDNHQNQYNGFSDMRKPADKRKRE